MTNYCIMLNNPRGLDCQDSVWRKRIDAVRYWAHHYVYEAFDAQGIRDTIAAHKALKAVYSTDFRNLPLDESGRHIWRYDCGGGYEIVINAGSN